jgi:hypothetical protein
MDVLHRQVDEYENEIRALKDFKSPKSARRTSMSSRASPFMSPGFSAKSTPAGGEPLSEATIGSLEAALARPALEAARQDASRYKALSMTASLNSLPPLGLVVPSSMKQEYFKQSHSMNGLEYLANALSEARSQVRMQKASVTVVDLSKSDKPRQALMDSMSKTYIAEMKLADVVFATGRWLGNQGGTVVGDESSHLLGKVMISSESSSSIPVTMNKVAMNRLHNCMVR